MGSLWPTFTFSILRNVIYVFIISKIEFYIAKKELQNEKGLDKYIDMILTEKAEKKK